MKVLHVTVWPGPPFSGANVNCYNFLKRLAPHHAARFIVVTDTVTTAAMTGEKLTALGMPNEGTDILAHPSVSWSDMLRGCVLSGLPPYIAFLERVVGARLRQTAERVIASWNPDLLMVWWAGFASLVLPLPRVPRVLYACDSLSFAAQNATIHAQNPWRRAYHRLVARRSRTYEQSVYPQFDEVVFISQRDAHHAALPNLTRVAVIPNGVDAENLRPLELPGARSRPPVIAFHGRLAFPPNAECVRFLVDELGSRLQEKLKPGGFELRVIGGDADSDLVELQRGRSWFNLTGYVDDLRESLASATVYVAPIQSGAGIKNKVLDAMACGLPVVGTDEAFSGLDVIPGVHCVVCSRAQMSEAVIDLLQDPKRRQSLGAAAREWVMKNANWDTLADRFDEVLRRASGKAAA
ncbi:MAG: glycosyltransferase family 4 protein [Thermodesulfobacteriota bacterium]